MEPVQILGALMIAAVLGSLFTISSKIMGWRVALATWVISLLMVVVFALGVSLLVKS